MKNNEKILRVLKWLSWIAGVGIAATVTLTWGVPPTP